MTSRPNAPFDTDHLDRLMEAAGIDLLFATSKPVVQYLLGGYRFFFFEHADSIGQSRYLPVVVYPKGRPDRAAYIGSWMEGYQQDVSPLWVPQVDNDSRGTQDAIRTAIEFAQASGLPARRVGVEMAFLPADATRLLGDAFQNAELIDALSVLERLRARKTPAEIEKLRIASDRVIESMLEVMETHGPGTTKRELAEALRVAETRRGLQFDYCLLTAGTSVNRAPSEQRWEQGDILSLDSGGNYDGYIGDICRMGILGEPDAELRDLLAEVDSVQLAAMGAARAGALGQAIYDGAEAALRRAPHRPNIEFVAHGMGLVTHEVPHLTAKGPVPYAAEDADRPLEEGMVLSIETTMHHTTRGFIKLEDTVLVREGGHEILGAAGRGWNRGNTRPHAKAA